MFLNFDGRVYFRFRLSLDFAVIEFNEERAISSVFVEFILTILFILTTEMAFAIDIYAT